MSDPPAFPGPPPPHERSGCLIAIAVVVGLLMLLPGICAIIITGLDPKEVLRDPTALFAMLAFLLIGVGGILLIRWAIKRPSQ
jgi:hypothetical protein